MERLLLVFLLTVIINLINTLTRSSRLAGVRTGHLATAISLFGVVYLAASFANTLQSPLLASTVERIIDDASSQSLLVEPGVNGTSSLPYLEALSGLNLKLRMIIFGATTGTFLGMLLIPSFITSFSNSINAFGQTGSVFRVIMMILGSMLRPGSGIVKFRLPSWLTLKRILFSRMTIPSSFLYWNLISYSLWTANVLSGLYAGALYPEFRSTAVLMASIVGNASIVLNVMMVDPVLARVTDAVARGEKDEAELKQIIFYLAFSNLLGTLFSQVIFEPIAQGLQILTKLIS
ncbi:MAG: DUF2837 family protein [Desulfotomaculaceae bacterium]|nr:DUF2837 family protein [Desulfotomaculaceae bacterium]